MARKSKHQMLAQQRYYMLNKPSGWVSACRDSQHQTVLDCFPLEEREGLFPVGRLDKTTEGLLLITDDGKLNRRLLAPESHVEKRYRFWAAGELTEEKIDLLSKGLRVKGIPEVLKPVQVRLIQVLKLREVPVPIYDNRRELAEAHPDLPAFCGELVMTEGKRHQVKRMMEAIDCTVVSLRRIVFAGLTLDAALAPGEYRALTPPELALLGVGRPMDGSKKKE